ncbi:MAG: SPOR domain-containing protein [Beijerinckiaceae bacterium]|nr:SPOR domain-containing protein [Beijerinckiaceae bacterium]
MSEPNVKRRPMIDLEEFERRLRKPLTLSQEDNDPLAELARFVGEQEDPHREDPYKSVLEPLNWRPAEYNRGGAASGEARERGFQEPLIRGDFASVEAGLLGVAHSEGPAGQQTEFDLERDGGTGTMQPWPYPGAEASSSDSQPFEEIRSRRPLYIMAAVIVAGMAGIGASFAFKGAVSSTDEVATISPADGPAKVQPETASASESPGQDATILGGAPQTPPVSAVSSIEQPADLAAQTEAPEAQGAIADSAAGAVSVPVPPPPAQAQVQPPAEPQSIAQLIEPKKVKTVSVRPDGTLMPAEAQPQAAAPPPPAAAPRAAPPAAAKAPAPKTVVRAAPAPKPAPVDASGNPQQPAQTTVAAKAKRPPATAPREQAPAAEAAPAAFAVQLAAPGSEQEARDLQARLVKKFGSELAGYQPSIHKAAVGGKDVYRVRVVGLSSREQATALCQKVQSSGGNCFVAKY